MIKYAISDSSNLNFSSLCDDISYIKQKGANYILYRDKNNPFYSKNAVEFIECSKKFNFDKILLHRDIELARDLNANGVHLSSDMIDKVSLAKRYNLYTIVSTHNLKDIELAQKLGADAVTLSPLFDTPNKGKPIGIDRFSEIVKSVSIPVIALGGILSNSQINLAIEAGACGFASIRYFRE